MVLWSTLALFIWVTASCLPLRAETYASLDDALQKVRNQYHLPALAGAIFTTDGVVEMGAVGVRKRGTDVPVTINDLWHLGSDTKMMTAMLLGTYVAEGKVSWNDTVVSFFPRIGESVSPAMRKITLAQVLSHTAGLQENLPWGEISRKGTLQEQRLRSVRLALEAPAFPPGTFHYANTDYVVIGAVLEKISGEPWEKLMRERLFRPLQMNTAGFHGTGTPGQINQPWPHDANGQPMPTNGPMQDNPEVMGPAGTVHCDMKDWAKFLIDQLRGGSGLPALLPNSIYQAMQTAQPGCDYGFGWIVTKRPWAGGTALNHVGSNTMNLANVWLAPNRKFGVLACTNQGGADAQKAADEMVGILIQRYLASQKTGQ